MRGFVLWFDERSDDGILTDFDGNEWYFNSWSFEGTRYRARGICKKTGRKKTILTRHYPGLFMQAGHIPDARCKRVKHLTPVVFEQADGISHRWAVKIEFDRSRRAREDVWGYQMICALESLESVSAKACEDIWRPHYEGLVERLIEEASCRSSH